LGGGSIFLPIPVNALQVNQKTADWNFTEGRTIRYIGTGPITIRWHLDIIADPGSSTWMWMNIGNSATVCSACSTDTTKPNAMVIVTPTGVYTGIGGHSTATLQQNDYVSFWLLGVLIVETFHLSVERVGGTIGPTGPAGPCCTTPAVLNTKMTFDGPFRVIMIAGQSNAFCGRLETDVDFQSTSLFFAQGFAGGEPRIMQFGSTGRLRYKVFPAYEPLDGPDRGCLRRIGSAYMLARMILDFEDRNYIKNPPFLLVLYAIAGIGFDRTGYQGPIGWVNHSVTWNVDSFYSGEARAKIGAAMATHVNNTLFSINWAQGEADVWQFPCNPELRTWPSNASRLWTYEQMLSYVGNATVATVQSFRNQAGAKYAHVFLPQPPLHQVQSVGINWTCGDSQARSLNGRVAAALGNASVIDTSDLETIIDEDVHWHAISHFRIAQRMFRNWLTWRT
jgi:hypothetical protein